MRLFLHLTLRMGILASCSFISASPHVAKQSFVRHLAPTMQNEKQSNILVFTSNRLMVRFLALFAAIQRMSHWPIRAVQNGFGTSCCHVPDSFRLSYITKSAIVPVCEFGDR